MELRDDKHCFACGQTNPHGLHLSFEYSDDGTTVWTHFVPAKQHEGWDGILHGGITATVLDEAAAKLVHNMGVTGVTGRLDVRYLKPALVGERLEFRASLLRRRGRIAEVKVEGRKEDGERAREEHPARMPLQKSFHSACRPGS